jgi:phosphatidylserine/phosphatidylglycerophosphate/cardiolipin synthase-like enzyme
MSGEEWFSNEFNKGMSQVFKNSWVEGFVDADEYFTDLRKEVEQTGAGDIICWIGFEASGKTPMPVQPNNEAEKSCPPRSAGTNDKTWLELLTEADKRNVSIRALLNLYPSPVPSDRYKLFNFDLVAELNKLNNCNAINDFRYLYLNGTHHQKLVLVYNAKKGLMAYPGTCDVETDRIVMKWCEVHCKIMGDAALELYDLFHKRYKEHTEVFARIRDTGKTYLRSSDQLKATAPQSGNFLVQVGTTYGNPNRNNPFYPLLPKFSCPFKQVVNGPHRVEISSGNLWLSPAVWTMVGNDFFMEKEKTAKQLIEEGMKQNHTYSFARDGHTGIYYMIKKAIETTKKFIYMEDQYLVNDDKMGSMDSMLTLLLNKLKEDQFKKLILFTTRIDDINKEFLGTAWKHRNNFITKLVSAAPSKVEVCQYKQKGKVGCSGDDWRGIFYIHSKTWIFDDELLITGSANCNRRGYSHDSESNVSVYDQNKFFVKELRKRIWKRRLNVKGISRSPLQDNDVDDFLSACKYWAKPDDYGMAIENSKHINFQPSKNPDLDATQLADKIVANEPEKSFIKGFIQKHKMDALWNLVVDPDGV